jgi:hypothetical protein
MHLFGISSLGMYCLTRQLLDKIFKSLFQLCIVPGTIPNIQRNFNVGKDADPFQIHAIDTATLHRKK